MCTHTHIHKYVYILYTFSGLDKKQTYIDVYSALRAREMVEKRLQLMTFVFFFFCYMEGS